MFLDIRQLFLDEEIELLANLQRKFWQINLGIDFESLGLIHLLK